MRQDLIWFPSRKDDEFKTLNTRKTKDELKPSDLQSISNFTFDEVGAIKKIAGNSIVTNGVVTENTSQPNDTTMVDCYWDDAGDVQNDTFLKRDFLAIKFPDAFFAGLSDTILSATLSLYTVTGDTYNGTLYQNTADFTEADADPPTYEAGSSVALAGSGAGIEQQFSLPVSWITDMVSNNYGVQGVATSDPDGYYYSSVGLGAQYGDGSDGEITVTSGTVNIEDIYEDENVSGVTTSNGAGKGLNNGAGTYDPDNDAFIQATDFTIQSGATLTHGTAYGAGGSDKNGVIYIGCTGTFTNEGTVTVNDLGANGGAGVTRSSTGFTVGNDGVGSGLGNKGGPTSANGAGGSSYGTSAIPETTWADLYGSGGGSGQAGVGVSGSSTTGNGGTGGGAIRIFASTLVTSSGTITANGGTAGAGSGTASYRSNGSGGGSGGTIYLETLDGTLGTDKLTASLGTGSVTVTTITLAGGSAGGAGGVSAGTAGVDADGGDGSVGRIHVEGTYSGSTSDPAIV